MPSKRSKEIIIFKAHVFIFYTVIFTSHFHLKAASWFTEEGMLNEQSWKDFIPPQSNQFALDDTNDDTNSEKTLTTPSSPTGSLTPPNELSESASNNFSDIALNRNSFFTFKDFLSYKKQYEKQQQKEKIALLNRDIEQKERIKKLQQEIAELKKQLSKKVNPQRLLLTRRQQKANADIVRSQETEIKSLKEQSIFLYSHVQYLQQVINTLQQQTIILNTENSTLEKKIKQLEQQLTLDLSPITTNSSNVSPLPHS